MSERAPYSRVYWSIIDDPKFLEVYDDDKSLAAWCRLLLAADMAWPASAQIPISTKRPAFDKLVKVGLIDIRPGGRYRIHGLDAERGQRREAATRLRTGRDPDGPQLGTNRDPDAFGMPGRRRDEPRIDETRVAEPIAREGLPNLTDDVAAAWVAASGRTVLASGAFALDYIDDACRRHSSEAIVAAIIEARGTFNGSIPSTQQLTVAVRAILDPLNAPRVSAVEEAQHEADDRHARAVAETLRRAHAIGAHLEPHPRCPECQGVPA